MWLLAVVAASAHEPGISKVDLRGGALVLQVARADAVDPAHLLDGTRATVGGAPCTLGRPTVEADANGFVATADLACPAGDRVKVQAGWFDQLPAGHRTVVHDEGRPVAWLDAAHRTFEAHQDPPSPWVPVGGGAAAAAALGLGVLIPLWSASRKKALLRLRIRGRVDAGAPPGLGPVASDPWASAAS